MISFVGYQRRSRIRSMRDFALRFGRLLLIFLGLFLSHHCYCCNGFVVVISNRNNKTRRTIRCTTLRVNNNNNNNNNNKSNNNNNNNEEEISSYEETDGASKGFVSSLTGIVNTFTKINSNDETTTKTTSSSDNDNRPPPMDPNELLNRIRDDYIVNNYLWTGEIDFECFEETCKFTDPTLSFEGTDTFRTNTQNLVPFIKSNVENPQSILLDIQLTNEYVETRWNMKGDITGLFWKPKIDVIGRTKFWFRRRQQQRNDDNGNNNEEEDSPLGIYFYDEKWEIPAYKALLQLVTPTTGGGSN